MSFTTICPACAAGFAHTKCPVGQPFCMVSFIGSLAHEQIRLRLTMMKYVAALRFEAHPCSCEGCEMFATKLTGYGMRQG